MNIKKLCSALGVGLAFVAILSLLVAPVMAMDVEREHAYRYGTGGMNWTCYVWAHCCNGTFDVGYDVNGGLGVNYTINYFVYYGTPGFAYAAIEVTFHSIFSGDWVIYADAWCQPGSPITHGGSWIQL
jgi:hypothetical protein